MIGPVSSPNNSSSSVTFLLIKFGENLRYFYEWWRAIPGLSMNLKNLRKWTFVVLLLFGSASSVSAAIVPAPSPCEQGDVSEFPIRLGSSQNSYSYHYRLIRSQNPDAPLVIYIPGGPGNNSIGTDDSRVSKDYSLVLTDPRGSGCNASPEMLPSDITSEQIASDIVQLVHALKPKHYIVHGLSYGTVVATIFSNLIAAQNEVQPDAIILEGVFGHYEEASDEHTMFDAWKQIVPQFSSATRALLLSSEQNPYGLDSGSWAMAAYNLAYLGKVAWLPYSFDQLLKIFVDQQRGIQLPSDISSLPELRDDGSLPTGVDTYEAIACNELFYDPGFGILTSSYAHGFFELTGLQECYATSPHHYDSKLWQMRQRTLYIMGADDPATSLTQGLYHFTHQQNTNKAAVIVANGGHPALQIDLHDCMHDIYESAWAGSPISLALKKCSASTAVLGQ